MAVKDTPIFAQKVRSVQAICTAAKTTYGDITNAVLLCTVGADGGFLRKLRARPRNTVTATQCQLFITKASDTSNTSPFFADNVLGWPSGYTMAQTTKVPEADFGYTGADPRKLEAGDKVWVAAGVALAGGIVFEGELEEFS